MYSGKRKGHPATRKKAASGKKKRASPKKSPVTLYNCRPQYVKAARSFLATCRNRRRKARRSSH